MIEKIRHFVNECKKLARNAVIMCKRFGFGKRHRKYRHKLSYEILRHVKQSCHLRKKKTCQIKDVAAPVNHTLITKGSKNLEKNYEIARVMRKLLNIIIRIVPIIRYTLETWGQTTKSEIRLIKILKENWNWWKFDGDL